jgi:hypothetical protein
MFGAPYQGVRQQVIQRDGRGRLETKRHTADVSSKRDGFQP